VERLQKYLASCGVASRRACEDLITGGRVTVNGAVATLGQRVDPGTDRVLLDGRPVSSDEKAYIVLHKPAGTITTAHDPAGRRTVFSCLEGLPQRVFAVGRLDLDVEGVLLLTNDGELAHRLMHPSFEVDKVYLAHVHGRMEECDARRMEQGVALEDGPAHAEKVEILHAGQVSSHIRLVMNEGRKREVKRLCEAVGHPVRTLERIEFAKITACGLKAGEWRHLSPEEIQGLRALTGLD
jgi:pseudouridine synthase